MDFASIMAAYEGLKAGKEILGGLLQTKIEKEVRDKISEVQKKLGEAQDTLFGLREELFRLQSENDALRKQISEHENWEGQLAQYSLTNTSGGAVVYASKGTPTHYACPNCITERKIQILQDLGPYSGGFVCPGCKHIFRIRPPKNLPQNNSGWDPFV
jgi:hypothetical protein